MCFLEKLSSQVVELHFLVIISCKPDVPCTSACKPAACLELGCCTQALQPTAYAGSPQHPHLQFTASQGACPPSHFPSAPQGAAERGQVSRWPYLYSEWPGCAVVFSVRTPSSPLAPSFETSPSSINNGNRFINEHAGLEAHSRSGALQYP